MSKEYLIQSVSDTFTLSEAEINFLDALKTLREKYPKTKIYYVIGTVTSDGPEHIDENLQILKKRSTLLGHEVDGIVFSAADIFNQKLFDRFNSNGAVNQDYLNFWEHILESKLITDIVRTPRWEKSMGASHENRIASRVGISIHDYSDFITE